MRGTIIAGYYFPLGELKAPFWSWVIKAATALRDSAALLVGDFNTGKHKIDEEFSTFISPEFIDALEAVGFSDTWRSAHSDAREYTWFSDCDNGFRLDYIWASPAVQSGVRAVWHDHSPREMGMSDHSALLADIDLPASLSSPST